MHKNLNDLLVEEFIRIELERLRSVFIQARVLDLGCGDMRYSKYLRYNGWSVLHADHEKRADGIDMLLDAHCLPFPDNYFDIILMSEVLEHLHHPQLALREISRVLRQDGIMIITFPFLWQIHELPYDFTRFTEFGFFVLARDSGLSIERFKRRGDSVALMLSLVDMKIMGVIQVLFKNKKVKFIATALQAAASVIASAIYFIYLAASKNSNALINIMPGDNLGSPIGKLRLWHLGYNMICKKVRN